MNRESAELLRAWPAKVISRFAHSIFLFFAATQLIACQPVESRIATSAGLSTAQPDISNHAAISKTEAQCREAAELLNTCAYENECSTEITLFLPSAARGKYVEFSKQRWFSEADFDRYCVAACQARSGHVEISAFTLDVCSASAPFAQQRTSALDAPIAFFIEELAVPITGIPLSDVISQLGAPQHVTESEFSCDSAFDEEQARMYSYPGAQFETNGRLAILRSIRNDTSARILLGEVDLSHLTEEQVKTIMGSRLTLISDHIFRTSTLPGGDLESSFDFHFANGKLDFVTYRIGC